MKQISTFGSPRLSNAQKGFHFLSMITLLLAIFLIAFFAYKINFEGGEVATFSDFRTDKEGYRVGETVYLIGTVCKTIDVGPDTKFILRNDAGYFETTRAIDSGSHVAEGCVEIRPSAGAIPDNVIPGEYYYTMQMTYHVSPFRTVHRSVSTSFFVIGISTE